MEFDNIMNTGIREIISNAIRFWERLRPWYNAVLAVIVALVYITGMPVSAENVNINEVLVLFVLAVIANMLYCAAYIPDIGVQLSSMRAKWLQYRWILFVIGVTFAGILARFLSMDLFGIENF